MLYHVKVIPNSKKEKIDRIDENTFRIKLNALAIEGKANKALIKILSKILDIKQNQITIVSGKKSQHKIVEVKQ